MLPVRRSAAVQQHLLEDEEVVGGRDKPHRAHRGLRAGEHRRLRRVGGRDTDPGVVLAVIGRQHAAALGGRHVEEGVAHPEG